MAEWIVGQTKGLELRSQLKVAVIGFGNQGRPHALNLHDSGASVVVGLRPGSPSAEGAVSAGLRVTAIPEAVKQSDLVMVATPDESMGSLYEESIAAHLRPGQMLLLAHGFNIHFGRIVPPSLVDVGLVSPKGAGVWVRDSYLKGSGLPAMVAVHQDATGHAWERVIEYAEGIGSARAGLLKTTFQEETECDLFGEQAVLCGGIPALIRAGFSTLVEAGYSPEAAWFETVYEAKLIVDLLMARGERGMREAISNTAEFGGDLAADLLVDQDARIKMRGILDRIQSGEFADNWLAEAANGMPRLHAARTRAVTDVARDSVLREVPSLAERLGAQTAEPKPDSVQ
ncbi:MAG: ketol-acid reductoisomerase [Fimbriimonadaceae bacterium]|nr:ketol-acid reductoisomerase [Fimbriimonadaceae bacterium]